MIEQSAYLDHTVFFEIEQWGWPERALRKDWVMLRKPTLRFMAMPGGIDSYSHPI